MARLEGDIVSNYPDTLFVRQLTMRIFSEGAIPSSGLTGFAVNYVQFPVLEILISFLSHVSGFKIDTIMKLGSSLFICLGLLLLIVIFKRTLGSQVAITSGLIASTFNYYIPVVHAAMGLLYFAILVFGILHGKKSGIVIALVSLAAMAVSHDFTSVQVILVLVFASGFRWVLLRERHSELSFFTTMLVLSVTFLAWILYHTGSALATFAQILKILYESVQPALGEVPQIFYAPRTLGLIGLGGYFLLVAVGLGLFALGKVEKKLQTIFALCFGAAAYFMISSLPYALSTMYKVEGYGGSLLPRSLSFLYLIGAPVAVVVLDRLSGRILERRSHVSRSRACLAMLLLSIILMPTFYFFVTPMYYDMKAPWVGNDVRLPLSEWQTAGEWVGAHPPMHLQVHGDVLAMTFIGAVGNQEVFYITDISQTEFLLRHGRVTSAIVLDRSSPTLQSIQSIDWQSIPLDNLVYSDAGVLLVIAVR